MPKRKVKVENEGTAKRKRDSQEPKKESGSQYPEVPPHTVRLIKLIEYPSRVPSSSKDDDAAQSPHVYAQHAAAALGQTARESAGVVLWDILGRLRHIALGENPAAKYYSALAMSQVAQHLPRLDRIDFCHAMMDGNQTENKKDDHMWLTVQDLVHDDQTSNNRLVQILTKGRHLLSHDQSVYDTDNHLALEDTVLRTLDDRAIQLMSKSETTSSAKSEDYLKARINYQRTVMARRLGLLLPLAGAPDYVVEGLLQDELVGECITSADVKQSLKEQQQLEKQANKSKRSKKKPVEEEQPWHKRYGSVRALLVLEMQQRKLHKSHETPRTLLATDLLYSMFHPSWYVRHGACISIMALCQAWWTDEASASKSEYFGKWMHDILARALCVLCLDRFSDFFSEGGDLNAFASSPCFAFRLSHHSLHNCSTAPVRDVAARLVASLWRLAPTKTQHQTIDILLQLARHEVCDEWEVRQGGLLGLLYIWTNKSECIHGLEKVIQVASDGLLDRNDDVRSVSAKLLEQGLKCTTESSVLANLWTALDQVHSVSSCAADLLSLLAACVKSSQKLDVDAKVLNKLVDFYQNHESLSCQTHSLIVLGKILPELYSRGTVNQTLEILTNLYQSFWKPSTSFTEGSSEEKQRYLEAKDTCWSNVVDAISNYSCHNSDLNCKLRDFYREICHIYFGLADFVVSKQPCAPVPSTDSISSFRLSSQGWKIDSEDGTNFESSTRTVSQDDTFATRVKASKLLALLTSKLYSREDGPHVGSCLLFVLYAFIQSPWHYQAEAALILYASTSELTKDNAHLLDLFDVHDAHNSFYEFITCNKPLLCRTLDDSTGGDDLRADSKIKAEFCEMVQSVSNEVWTSKDLLEVETSAAWVAEQAQKLVKKWEMLFLDPCSNAEPRTQTTESWLRIQTAIAIAMVSRGRLHLPPKVSPVVQPLMTSIKVEDQTNRLNRVAHYIVKLHLALAASKDENICNNVVTSLCNIVCDKWKVFLLTKGKNFGAVEWAVRTLVEELKDDGFANLAPLKTRLDLIESETNQEKLCGYLYLLKSIASSFGKASLAIRELSLLPAVAKLALGSSLVVVRELATDCLTAICLTDARHSLPLIVPTIFTALKEMDDESCRLGACKLLQSIVNELGVYICPFVKCLLPAAMSSMNDSCLECSKASASTFGALVRAAPLVKEHDDDDHHDENGGTFEAMKGLPNFSSVADAETSQQVIAHLIFGKALPPCDLPPILKAEMKGVQLRQYQIEGISWIRFLASVNLNGALCDDMGLGKTLQTLTAVGISYALPSANSSLPTLVVCPSSVVGHWMNEVNRFFQSGNIFRPLQYTGDVKRRKALCAKISTAMSYNLVVTNYAILRNDIDQLSRIKWNYCILDEGHLLKNPKTATAKASRQIKCRHKLLLTGTPVQNRVQELWSVFDFLMPNYLGTDDQFHQKFAKAIRNGQLPGASAADIGLGMEKLKLLHQQVLPFILRREKTQVLQDLPDKVISSIPCELGPLQSEVYQALCESEEAKQSLKALQLYIANSNIREKEGSEKINNALKSLLLLRMACTHPCLVMNRDKGSKSGKRSIGDEELSRLENGGKLVVLNDLLRGAGIYGTGLTAADNDTSALYTNSDNDDDDNLIRNGSDDLGFNHQGNPFAVLSSETHNKCLIFAQFSKSLDIVENFLFRPHMPYLNYVRLDAKLSMDERTRMVDEFNGDESIRVMLLTTKIGGLGLNLTSANMVIFLEHDWNPHADLQAMDRAHRIGQRNTVHVYRLVTKGTIEEKIMKIQELKMAMSAAIVNSENSSMYSMGTDKLLDLFTFEADESSSVIQLDKKQVKARQKMLGINVDSLGLSPEDQDVDGFFDTFK